MDIFLEYLEERIKNLKSIIDFADKNKSQISKKYYSDKLFVIEEILYEYRKTKTTKTS
jgi:hypothetical protein